MRWPTIALRWRVHECPILQPISCNSEKSYSCPVRCCLNKIEQGWQRLAVVKGFFNLSCFPFCKKKLFLRHMLRCIRRKANNRCTVFHFTDVVVLTQLRSCFMSCGRVLQSVGGMYDKELMRPVGVRINGRNMKDGTIRKRMCTM